MKKAIASTHPMALLLAIPSWARAVMRPKLPRVMAGRRLKRWLLRCNTIPPVMLPAASTLVNRPRA